MTEQGLPGSDGSVCALSGRALRGGQYGEALGARLSPPLHRVRQGWAVGGFPFLPPPTPSPSKALGGGEGGAAWLVGPQLGGRVAPGVRPLTAGGWGVPCEERGLLSQARHPPWGGCAGRGKGTVQGSLRKVGRVGPRQKLLPRPLQT